MKQLSLLLLLLCIVNYSWGTTEWHLKTAADIYKRDKARMDNYQAKKDMWLEKRNKEPYKQGKWWVYDSRAYIAGRRVSGIKKSIKINIRSYGVTLDQVKAYIADPTSSSIVKKDQENRDKEKLAREILLASQHLDFKKDDLGRETQRANGGLNAGVFTKAQADEIIAKAKAAVEEAREKLRAIKSQATGSYTNSKGTGSTQ